MEKGFLLHTSISGSRGVFRKQMVNKNNCSQIGINYCRRKEKTRRIFHLKKWVAKKTNKRRRNGLEWVGVNWRSFRRLLSYLRFTVHFLLQIPYVHVGRSRRLFQNHCATITFFSRRLWGGIDLIP